MAGDGWTPVDESAWTPVAGAAPTTGQSVLDTLRANVAAYPKPQKDDRGAFESAYDTLPGAGAQVSDVWNGAKYAVQHPIDSLNLLGNAASDAQTATFDRGFQRMNAGDKSGGALQVAEGMIPVVGPALATSSNQAQTGNMPGAIGTALGVGGQVAMGTPEAKAAGLSTLENIRNGVRGAGNAGADALIDSTLKTKASDLRFGKNPVQGVLDEGITGNSKQDFLDKIRARKEQAGAAIDAEVGKPEHAGKTADYSRTITDPIDQAMLKAQQAGKPGLVTQLRTLRDAVTTQYETATDGTPVAIGKRDLSELAPKEALKLKREIGEGATWANDPEGMAVNQVRREVYSNIRGKLERQVPTIGKMNSRYANMLSAEKALDRSMKTNSSNPAVADALIYGSAIPELALGHPEAAAATVGGRLLARGANSVAAKTRVANFLNNARNQSPKQMRIQSPAEQFAANPNAAAGVPNPDLDAQLRQAVATSPLQTPAAQAVDVSALQAKYPHLFNRK